MINVAALGPDAHMYPSDLEMFRFEEATATAFSIKVGSADTGETTVPLVTTDQAEAYAAAKVREAQQWHPIETAPKNRAVLLGGFNAHGKWRTMRGEWFSKEHIDENWDDADGFESGWYETSVEADDVPSCWPTTPSHWMPLPAPLSTPAQLG